MEFKFDFDEEIEMTEEEFECYPIENEEHIQIEGGKE